MFTKAVYARFDRESHFLGRLTKLKQTGSMTDFITAFEQLAIRTEGLSNEFYLECFISGLKDTIKAHVCMHHLATWLQACHLAKEAETILQAQPLRTAVPNRPCPGATSAQTQTLKVQKVSPAEMAERHKQGLCYYCDDKYSSSHKCREQKFFQIDGSATTSAEDNMSSEAIDSEDTQPTSPIPDPVTSPVEAKEPIISLHALAGISAPQALKIKGYIKHRPIVVLIDSDSTLNFIYRRVPGSLRMSIALLDQFLIFKFS